MGNYLDSVDQDRYLTTAHTSEEGIRVAYVDAADGRPVKLRIDGVLGRRRELLDEDIRSMYLQVKEKFTRRQRDKVLNALHGMPGFSEHLAKNLFEN